MGIDVRVPIADCRGVVVLDSRESIAACLAGSLRRHSSWLSSHQDRVGRLSAALGGILGLDGGHIDKLRFGASLHDVGKLTIPATVVDGGAPLDADGALAIRQHPRAGADLLVRANAAVLDPMLELASVVALYHHEYYDGSGYPFGLRGEGIPREARMVAVCDVYSALREERPYKRPMEHEQALSLILGASPGGRVRPAMFDPFLLGVLEARGEDFRHAFGASGAGAYEADGGS